MPPKRTPRASVHSASDVRLSKKLSTLLRHRAHLNNITMTADGFVAVPALLALPQFAQVTPADLARVVAVDSKRRFTLVDDRIRANQGHSLEGVVTADALLTHLSAVDAAAHPVCVHGTSMGAWGGIRVDGLRKMGRLHVHFARGLPGESGVLSGFRASWEVLVYVDVARAIDEGVEFFLSENGVLLTPGIFYKGNEGVVPPHLFEKVVERRSGKSLL